MPDLMTHVLAAYILGTLLSIRYEWITPPLVTAAMAGAFIPDITKISLLVPSAQVEVLLGIPFDWGAIHKLGGTAVAVLIGALLTSSPYRRRLFLMLALGAVSHHALDALLISASGHSYAILWPLSTYHPPTPGLFLSSDRWPAVMTAILAAGAWALRYRWLDR